ncbi:MAG: AIR synthase family protein [Caldilineaceae bacterium]
MHSFSSLPAGKVPAPLLARLLADLPVDDPQLLLGPAVGADAAVIDVGRDPELLWVAKSDPITFATDEIGYYAVNVCANDLAVTGAQPRFYLPTLLLPAGQTDAALVEHIFHQIGAVCRQLGIVVAGGHSEITPAVNQVVVAGTLLGEVARTKVVASQGAQVGDAVLLAGTIPVEGVSIIAREMRQALLKRGWSPAELDQAADYLYTPGISVLQPARLAAAEGLVTAMHDPTEGGIATGLQELATAANVGLTINLDAIPIPAVATHLCAAFDLDPLGVIASGALLATARPEAVAQLQRLWQDHGWSATVIGQVTADHNDVRALRNGRPVAFPSFAADEITKLWNP